MRRWMAAALIVVVAVGTVGGPQAQAHEPGASAVLIDVQADHAEAELQLPLDRLEVAVDLELDEMPDSVIVEHGEFLTAYLHDHIAVEGVDGVAWNIQMSGLSVDIVDSVPHLVAKFEITPPSGEMTAFVLHYDCIVHYLQTHDIVVVAGSGNGERSILGTLNHATDEIVVDVSGDATSFLDMAKLGFTHVLDGTDHLLFLVVLLLPAPLAVTSARRWTTSGTGTGWSSVRRVLQVATAFTIGHSLTLVASSMNWITVPSRPVEVAVGLSIAVAAVHALRPIVRHGEVIIAGGFGLIHGLAFAGILDVYGLSAGSTATGLVGFNSGVELAQVTTIALVFPSIYELSRGAYYRPFRRAGAAIALIASTSWVITRAGSWQNPLQPIELWVVDHQVLMIVGLAMLALASLVARHAVADAPMPAGSFRAAAAPSTQTGSRYGR